MTRLLQRDAALVQLRTHGDRSSRSPFLGPVPDVSNTKTSGTWAESDRDVGLGEFPACTDPERDGWLAGGRLRSGHPQSYGGDAHPAYATATRYSRSGRPLSRSRVDTLLRGRAGFVPPGLASAQGFGTARCKAPVQMLNRAWNDPLQGTHSNAQPSAAERHPRDMEAISPERTHN